MKWRVQMGVLGGAAGAFVLWQAWVGRHPIPVVAASDLVGAFEKGFVSDQFDRVDYAAAVPRPELHERLQAALRPSVSQHYLVVVDARGTGKSTAVRKAVRDAPSQGPNGVVYFVVGDDLPAFSKQLGDVMGFQFGDPVPALQPEPFASWSRLAPALESAALAFHNKHNRPMTLVIDDTEKILNGDRKFMDALLDYAKMAADAGHLRLVFVSSDFAVARYVRRRSSGSRCTTMEVGEDDISEETAVAFLVKKLGWDAEGFKTEQEKADAAAAARYIVANITGTRFGLLNAVNGNEHNAVEKAQAWERALQRECTEAIEACGIAPGHPLFGVMLDAPGQRVDSDELKTEAGLSTLQRDALVRAGVLLARPDCTYTCAARYVVGAFKALNTQQQRWWWSLWRRWK